MVANKMDSTSIIPIITPKRSETTATEVYLHEIV